MDIFNAAMVGVHGEFITVMNPIVMRQMTKEQALVVAAWLVALADFENEKFPAILAEVLST